MSADDRSCELLFGLFYIFEPNNKKNTIEYSGKIFEDALLKVHLTPKIFFAKTIKAYFVE